MTAYSGAKTGRSPLDKRIVKEEGSEKDIWWGPVNKPMTPEVSRSNVLLAMPKCLRHRTPMTTMQLSGTSPCPLQTPHELRLLSGLRRALSRLRLGSHPAFTIDRGSPALSLIGFCHVTCRFNQHQATFADLRIICSGLENQQRTRCRLSEHKKPYLCRRRVRRMG